MAGDLHCHTKMSDGSIGIEELILMAKRRNMCAISVTDHDTTAGATRAVIIGKRQGIKVIHGVEFSAFDKKRGRKAHILCYDCRKPDRLEGMCRKIGESRKKASLEQLRLVMRYYPIPMELVTRCATGSTNLFRQHIMHALMEAGYADSMYGEVYHQLFDPKEGVAYRMMDYYPEPQEVIDLIHSAGGVAVLAHPPVYHSEELMEELSENGLDGIEVYHTKHTEEQSAAYRQFAQEHGLLITGGSDFHGAYSSHPRPIGMNDVTDEMVQAILHRKRAIEI